MTKSFGFAWNVKVRDFTNVHVHMFECDFDTEHYICDDCDSKFLLACTICRHPYTQPTWYYGKGPSE